MSVNKVMLVGHLGKEPELKKINEYFHGLILFFASAE